MKLPHPVREQLQTLNVGGHGGQALFKLATDHGMDEQVCVVAAGMQLDQDIRD